LLTKDAIDETPMAYKAYKDTDAVIAAQQSLVEVVHALRQIVCVKGRFDCFRCNGGRRVLNPVFA
jgi:hypothetical protein